MYPNSCPESGFRASYQFVILLQLSCFVISIFLTSFEAFGLLILVVPASVWTHDVVVMPDGGRGRLPRPICDLAHRSEVTIRREEDRGGEMTGSIETGKPFVPETEVR